MATYCSLETPYHSLLIHMLRKILFHIFKGRSYSAKHFEVFKPEIHLNKSLNQILSKVLVSSKILFFCEVFFPYIFILEARILKKSFIKHGHTLNTSCQNGQVLQDT